LLLDLQGADPKSTLVLQEKLDRAGFDPKMNPEDRLLLTSVDAVQWASAVWGAWYRALTARQTPHHGIDEDPACNIVEHLASRYERDPASAIRFVKEQTTYLAAVGLGQSEGDVPIVAGLEPGQRPGIFGGGWVYAACSTILRGGRSLDTSQPHDRDFQIGRCADILLSKTAWPAVPESFVEKNVEEYIARMTTRHEGDHLIGVIKRRIKEVVRLIFTGKTFVPTDQLPSSNASFEFQRTWGGGLGYLMETWYKETFLRPEPSLASLFGEKRPEADIEPGDLPEDESVSTVHCQRGYDSAPEPTGRVSGLPETRTIPTPGTDLLQSFQNFVDKKVIDVVKSQEIHVLPFAIKEPGKTRIITLGEAAPTFRLLELQKFVHGVLRACPPFEFIGHPITDKDWARHFSAPMRPDQGINSGDFKNATDNLNPELSFYAHKQICKAVRLPDGSRLVDSPYYVAGILDLIGHVFHIDVVNSDLTGDPVKQQWGQLMGSILSFPVLCVVNFAVGSLGSGLTPSEALEPNAPLVVNGDDIAAVQTRTQYEYWKILAREAGLEFSLGKNYWSRTFCVMNSEFRSIRHYGQALEASGDPKKLEEQSRGPAGFTAFKPIGGLNQALLRGFEKKGQEAGQDLKPTMGWWELGARAQELVLDVPEPVGRRWMEIFRVYHAAILKTVPPGVQFGATPRLGGVGLPYCPPASDDGRKFHTAIALLDETSRQKLLSPPRKPRSWIDTQLAESAQYYAKRFGSHWEERPAMEIVLENWGFPVSRETSDVGSRLRLSYVLAQYVKLIKTTALRKPEILVEFQVGSGPRSRGSGKQRVANGVPSIGLVPKVDPEKWRQQVFRYGCRLTRFAKGAKGKVPALFEPITDEKLQIWQPPLEEIVDWPRLASATILRFRAGDINPKDFPRRVWSALKQKPVPGPPVEFYHHTRQVDSFVYTNSDLQRPPERARATPSSRPPLNIRRPDEDEPLPLTAFLEEEPAINPLGRTMAVFDATDPGLLIHFPPGSAFASVSRGGLTFRLVGEPTGQWRFIGSALSAEGDPEEEDRAFQAAMRYSLEKSLPVLGMQPVREILPQSLPLLQAPPRRHLDGHRAGPRRVSYYNREALTSFTD
jgi:hypothetical protein